MRNATRLILHIGTHKTGTTSFQDFIARNRAALHRQGVLYVPTPMVLGKPRRAHHRVSHILADDDAPADSRAALAAYVDNLRLRAAGMRGVILSSERFWRDGVGAGPQDGDTWARRLGFVHRLAEALHGFDVAVNAVFRRQDDLLVSAHRGRCMRTGQPSAPFALGNPPPASAAIATPPPDAPAAGLAVSLAYATNLETFARVFSRPKVHAHLYEAQARGSAGLLRLMARFGLPLDPAHDLVFEPDLHTAPLLPSTPDFFTWMVQPQDDATRIHRLRTHLLAVERDPAFADWLARVFAPAPRDLSALLSSADAENERLRAGWFPDAPAPLFGQPVATTLALHLPTDPEAIARRALALRAEALGDAPA